MQRLDNKKKGKKLEYKWVIISLCFLMIMLVLGFASSAKGIYVKPLTEYLGLERSLYSIGDSLRYLVVSILSVFFGTLVEKFGPKKLILAGLISILLALVCYATATDLTLIYIGGILLGVGFGWTTTTMVGYIVNLWNKKDKGTIMGFILAANGIGGGIGVQLLSPIINASPTGYKTSYFIVICIVAVIALLMLVFFKDKPPVEEESLPLEEKVEIKKDEWEGIDFKTAVKRPYFYITVFCVFVTGIMLQGATSVNAPMYADIGIDANMVSIILTVGMLFLALFKVVMGRVFDKLGLRTSVTICTISALASMIMLCFIDNSTFGIVLCFVYCFVSSIGCPLTTIMLPLYALGMFGQKSYPKILGIIVTANTVGNIFGEPLMNMFYDIMGNYQMGLYVVVLSLALVCVLIQIAMTLAQKERKNQTN